MGALTAPPPDRIGLNAEWTCPKYSRLFSTRRKYTGGIVPPQIQGQQRGMYLWATEEMWCSILCS